MTSPLITAVEVGEVTNSISFPTEMKNFQNQNMLFFLKSRRSNKYKYYIILPSFQIKVTHKSASLLEEQFELGKKSTSSLGILFKKLEWTWDEVKIFRPLAINWLHSKGNTFGACWGVARITISFVPWNTKKVLYIYKK